MDYKIQYKFDGWMTTNQSFDNYIDAAKEMRYLAAVAGLHVRVTVMGITIDEVDFSD